MLEKIWDKITWAVAYALLPITYPIMLIQERSERKKQKTYKKR